MIKTCMMNILTIFGKTVFFTREEEEQALEAMKGGGGMREVSKKILPKYFKEVYSGNKRFELRKDEDNIQAGDRLYLREWNGKAYTGNGYVTTVKYVLRNVPQYGLAEGYCIIGW